MAKKKQDDPPKGSPAWMATFSDLMNLLLCFFVLLFSMSSVDASKWEEVVASMTSAFSVFNDGSTSIGDGTLVGTGTTQLSNLDEYYSSLGQKATDDNEDEMKESGKDSDKPAIGEGTKPDSEQGEGSRPDSQQGDGAATEKSDAQSAVDTAEAFAAQVDKANREETAEMLDAVSELTERYNISSQLAVGMDDGGKYIEITISGSLLFDSGSAKLKDECKPLLSKVGDILKVYKGHSVDVIGHTDNVPMKSAKYDSNDILSSARAISTAQYLINEKNLDVTMISWTGRGEYDPIDTNATAEGRARNRRVEIRIYNSLNSN